MRHAEERCKRGHRDERKAEADRALDETAEAEADEDDDERFGGHGQP